MIPLDRYNSKYVYEAHTDRAYSLIRDCIHKWKRGQIEEAGKMFNEASYIIDEYTNDWDEGMYSSVQKQLKFIEFAYLTDPNPENLYAEKLVNQINKDSFEYAKGCALIAKFYFPSNPEKGLSYISEAENCYSKFIMSTLDDKEKIFFSYKFLAKSYRATKQPEKCLVTIKNIAEDNLRIQNPTERAWCLLKLVKLSLPLDLIYAKTLLKDAALTILTLNDKVIEKELKRMHMYASIL